MKSIINKSLFFLILIGLFLQSCEEKIDIELDSSFKRIVVEADLTNVSKEHLVKIQLTSDYFNSGPIEMVEGANVSISDGSIVEILSEKQKGYYYTNSNYKGEIGKTYTLTIDYNGNSYTAISELKQVAKMDSIKVLPLALTIDFPIKAPNVFSVLMYAQEPSSIGDYYLWDIYKNGVLESDTINEKNFTSDEFVNGNYISEFPVMDIEADLGDTIELEIRSISKSYYEFIFAIFSESYGGGPFSGAPSNVPSNFTNGAMGYFNASAVSSVEYVINSDDMDLMNYANSLSLLKP